MAFVEVDRSVREVKWLVPGTKGGWKTLENFCSNRLKDYAGKRNDPNVLAAGVKCLLISILASFLCSVLSCLSVEEDVSCESTSSFQEEAVVRRELSDNFCYYNQQYDSLDGCYDWARQV